MNYYETLMLIRPTTSDEELSTIEKGIELLVTNHAGHVAKNDRWGKMKLAYPVEHRDFGIYLLSRYQLPKASVADFFKQFQALLKIKFNAFIIRYAHVSLSPEQFVEEYPRPEAFDPNSTRPSRSVGAERIVPMAAAVVAEEVESDVVLQEN